MTDEFTWVQAIQKIESKWAGEEAPLGAALLVELAKDGRFHPVSDKQTQKYSIWIKINSAPGYRFLIDLRGTSKIDIYLPAENLSGVKATGLKFELKRFEGGVGRRTGRFSAIDNSETDFKGRDVVRVEVRSLSELCTAASVLIEPATGVSSSSRQETASPHTFLVKIHSDKCPGQNGAPNSSEEWEGGIFNIASKIRSADGTDVDLAILESGSKVYVWVHENEPGSNGRGLTAVGESLGCKGAADGSLELTLINVELLHSPSYLGIAELKHDGKNHSSVAARIARFALRQTIWMSPTEVEEWSSYLRERMQRIKLDDAERYELEHAVGPSNRGKLKQNLLKKMQEVTYRPGQGAFRQAVLLRYGFKCAVTGFDVPQGLDAAHVIAVAKDHSLAKNPRNGILLRCDLHRLFDQGLIWIEDGRLQLSSLIRGSAYAEFQGQVIDPLPYAKFCEVHAEAAMDRCREIDLGPRSTSSV